MRVTIRPRRCCKATGGFFRGCALAWARLRQPPSAERRRARPGNDDDRETDVFIPTTFLNGEPSRFVDAYGTLVSDVDHHGLFHFDNDRLQDASAVAQLALAARCSASFPVAFEPG